MGENILFLSAIILILRVIFADNIESGKSCQIKSDHNGPPVSGKCTPLLQCEYAVGNMRSGILPTSCGKKSSEVCCPSVPNISTRRCEDFKNALRTFTKKSVTGKIANYGFSEKNQRSKNTEKNSNPIECEIFLSNYISGGRDAHKHEYPHQVALGFGSRDLSWRCGGVLISDQYVLTAGHCVMPNSKNGQPKKVLLGDIKLSLEMDADRTLEDVHKIYIHPDYKPPLLYNDIALIQLKSKVKFSRAVLPACLPQPQDRLDKIPSVEATGWGQLGALGNQSDILQTVTISKISSKDCTNSFKGDASLKTRLPYGIIRSQFCASDKIGLKDTCKGDSGGPVVVTKGETCVYYVIGITSFGSNFCGYQQPGVYTNVLRYLSWIEGIVWPESLSNGAQVEASTAKVSTLNLVFPTIASTTTTTTTERRTSAPLVLVDTPTDATKSQSLKSKSFEPKFNATKVSWQMFPTNMSIIASTTSPSFQKYGIDKLHPISNSNANLKDVKNETETVHPKNTVQLIQAFLKSKYSYANLLSNLKLQLAGLVSTQKVQGMLSESSSESSK